MRSADMMAAERRETVSQRPIQYAVVLVTLLATFGSAAQPPPEHHHDVANRSVWTWSTDANVIAGYNYQQRKFADFWAWESQNWVMGMAERPLGPGKLTLNG